MLTLENLQHRYESIQKIDDLSFKVKELQDFILACEEYLTQCPAYERKFELPFATDILALLKLAEQENHLLHKPIFDPHCHNHFFKAADSIWGQPLYLQPHLHSEKIAFHSKNEASLNNWLQGDTTFQTFKEYLWGLRMIQKSLVDYSDMSHLRVAFNNDREIYYVKTGEILKNTVTVSARYNNVYPYLIVATLNGDLYVAPESYNGNIRHSSFTQGEPVLFAGMIQVEDGSLTGFNNQSGHYFPKKASVLNFLKLLRDKYEVDLQTIVFSAYGHSVEYYASDYLETQGIDCTLKEDNGKEAYDKFWLIYQRKAWGANFTQEDISLMRIYLEHAFKLNESYAYLAISRQYLEGYLYDQNFDTAFSIWQQMEEKALHDKDFAFVWFRFSTGDFKDKQYIEHEAAYLDYKKTQKVSSYVN